MWRRPAVALLICAALFVGFQMLGCSRTEPNGPHDVVPRPHATIPTRPRKRTTTLRRPSKTICSPTTILDPKRLPPLRSQPHRQPEARRLGSATRVRRSFGLDCPIIKPDYQGDCWFCENRSPTRSGTLPTLCCRAANLADGAAKQFDDGLYAALDLACYKGELGFGISGTRPRAKRFWQVADR